VVDASVIVKWVFADSDREENIPESLSLLAAIRVGVASPLQPPHWIAEVAAVITRKKPEKASPALELLDALELPVLANVTVYQRAAQLAADLGHHLFDTLYHAVALESGSILVTADDTYFRKAGKLGGIMKLAMWPEEVFADPRRLVPKA
jgi:predicted nucleic acid-binding protein